MQIPEGFKEVNQDEFYAVIGPLDVEVYAERAITRFTLKSSRKIIGVTEGYAADRKFYALVRGVARNAR